MSINFQKKTWIVTSNYADPETGEREEIRCDDKRDAERVARQRNKTVPLPSGHEWFAYGYYE